ncbi:hypothetical protein [Caulobacter phage Kronos]|uniref:Uncharacterized protein n=1 Tax=Caulobacter phage Kronos TaxID=2340873 RepID=A0A386KQ19_9CAUD|nr:hypothetical protein [Caulobacter phage Kronos]
MRLDAEGRRPGQPGTAWREPAPGVWVVTCKNGAVCMKTEGGRIAWLKGGPK